MLRRTSFLSTNFIGQSLVVANSKPVFSTIRRTCLQHPMQLLDKISREMVSSMVNNHIDATEMVDSFHNIVHIDRSLGHTDGICLKNIASLLVRQLATFYMVRVVSEVYLCFMIDATLQPHLFLFAQSCQQCRNIVFLSHIISNLI